MTVGSISKIFSQGNYSLPRPESESDSAAKAAREIGAIESSGEHKGALLSYPGSPGPF